MSIGRFALMRPIKQSTSSAVVNVYQPYDDVSYTARDVSVGTFGMMPSLLQDFVDNVPDVTNLEAGFVTSGDDIGKIYFRSDTHSFKFTWQDTDYRDALGFSGTASTGGSTSGGYYIVTADYVSPYVWVSSHGTSDRDTWRSNMKESFTGTIAQDGTMSGVGTGDVLYRWDLRVVMEEAAKVFESRALTSVNTVRSLEYFIRESMRQTPRVAGDTNPRGFYLWYDVDDLTVTDTFSNEGIDYRLASSPDLYAYCSIDPKGWGEPEASVGRSMDYWNLSLPLIKASQPTWSAP